MDIFSNMFWKSLAEYSYPCLWIAMFGVYLASLTCLRNCSIYDQGC